MNKYVVNHPKAMKRTDGKCMDVFVRGLCFIDTTLLGKWVQLVVEGHVEMSGEIKPFRATSEMMNVRPNPRNKAPLEAKDEDLLH